MRSWIPLASLLLLLAAACANDDPTATPRPPLTPTPTVAGQVAPTPTPGLDATEASREQTVRVVRQFSEEFTGLSTAWSGFERDFDEWRHGVAGCGVADRQADLAMWVNDFRAVVTAVTAVDLPSGTSDVRLGMASAFGNEENGLQALRDTWVPGSNAAFAAYESARTTASTLRQSARARLFELVALLDATPVPTPTPEEGPPGGFGPPGVPSPDSTAPPATADELAALGTDLDAAEEVWDAFHERYDTWRAADGSCDQQAVRNRLLEFSVQFGQIVDLATAVQRPSVARPLGERLIDAAVIESQALGVLLTNWVAYDPTPWTAIALARAQADFQRRQVRSSLGELNLEFGLSSS